MEVTLTDLLAAVKKPKAEIVDVDVTPYFTVPEGETRLLQWQCPDLSALYQVGKDAAQLKERFPMWDEQLAIDVALFGACHAGPDMGGTSPGLFYAGLANSGNGKLWAHLMHRLSLEFPHLRPSSMPMFDELLDACAELYHRHPDELSHLSGTLMKELIDARNRKTRI